jgi:hypothetical protein
MTIKKKVNTSTPFFIVFINYSKKLSNINLVKFLFVCSGMMHHALGAPPNHSKFHLKFFVNHRSILFCF